MSEEKIRKIFKVSSERIEGFFHHYRFLSNFYMAPVVYDGLEYPSTEHAYQAAKTFDLEKRKECSNLSKASQARLWGQKIGLREDWENVKIQVMEDIVRDKFQRHEDLKDLLLQTEDKYLEETNWWKCTVWGVCDGVGENHLGKILMKIRDEIRNNKCT